MVFVDIAFPKKGLFLKAYVYTIHKGTEEPTEPAEREGEKEKDRWTDGTGRA